MKIHDISVTISPQLAVWPGDRAVYLQREQSIERGDEVNVSRMDISVHTGTHIDAPLHFIPDGRPVEQIPLDVLVGRAQVVQVPHEVNLITPSEIHAAQIKPGIERVIFKTRNSTFFPSDSGQFHQDFTGISVEGAETLVKMGVKLVGMDYLSVAPYQDPRPAHVVFLSSEVILLEGLDLAMISPGEYLLCCLPLKLAGSDGAPARVVLIEE